MDLKFTYHGTELPTDEMVSWYDIEKEDESTMNGLEKDMYYSRILSSFLEYFSEELSELSYMEMIDVFDNC